jgi:putative FmdB family regulatory protein
MPIYDYECQTCGHVAEVLHRISELTEPNEETLKEITCPIEGHGIMQRLVSAPHLANMQGGVSVPEKVILNKKQQQRKKRSSTHFKNEVLPTLKAGEKRHFEKKLKNIKGDHEKM